MNELAIDLSSLPFERVCEYCGSEIEGRSDKRFCNNVCGVSFEREESRLETYAECLCEALANKASAKHRKNLQDLRQAQLDIEKSAISMLEIFERRANIAPTVNRAVLLFFKNEVLAELFDINETSGAYPSIDNHFNSFLLSEMTNPFSGDKE